jgi:hypothetical protein
MASSIRSSISWSNGKRNERQATCSVANLAVADGLAISVSGWKNKAVEEGTEDNASHIFRGCTFFVIVALQLIPGKATETVTYPGAVPMMGGPRVLVNQHLELTLKRKRLPFWTQIRHGQASTLDSCCIVMQWVRCLPDRAIAWRSQLRTVKDFIRDGSRLTLDVDAIDSQHEV